MEPILMSVEIKIKIKDTERIKNMLLGMDCPLENCNGQLQTYESYINGKPTIKIACYTCGTTVNPNNVKAVIEVKTKT